MPKRRGYCVMGDWSSRKIIDVNEFIKSEKIKAQETQLERIQQAREENIVKMQEKIAEIEIRLSTNDWFFPFFFIFILNYI